MLKFLCSSPINDCSPSWPILQSASSVWMHIGKSWHKSLRKISPVEWKATIWPMSSTLLAPQENPKACSLPIKICCTPPLPVWCIMNLWRACSYFLHISLIAHHRISHFTWATFLYALLLEQATTEELRSLRVVTFGGEPCPSSLVE